MGVNLTNFNESSDFKETDEEIFQYISDKRILRVLFEQKIFKLRDIQKQAIERGLFFRKSFLVCAPSGSGKTLIGEICVINNLFQNLGKSVYLVPFKALATEKYIDFKERFPSEERLIKNQIIHFGKQQKIQSVTIDNNEELYFIVKNVYDHTEKGEIQDG